MAETTTKKKPTAQVIDGTGSSTGTRDLPAEIFGVEVNEAIIHEVMVAELAAARRGTASTKTRAEVRGGGKKPWRQKGTGRARHGSIRSPQWVGGGRVGGPKPRDYAVKVNKKVRAAALRSVLTDKVNNGALWVLDGFSETKTKAAATALTTAGIEGRVLIVLDPKEGTSQAVDRAFKNLDSAAFALQGSLSTYDVLVADALVFTPGALDSFVERSTGGKS
jgi:large subunit ribosomal protein L4